MDTMDSVCMDIIMVLEDLACIIMDTMGLACMDIMDIMDSVCMDIMVLVDLVCIIMDMDLVCMDIMD